MSIKFVIALAVFLGLLLFLYQQVRKAGWPIVLGEVPRAPKSRWRVVLATVLVLIAGILIWAFFVEPNLLVVRHQTIQISDWPRELRSLDAAAANRRNNQSGSCRSANNRTYTQPGHLSKTSFACAVVAGRSHSWWASQIPVNR